MVDVPTFVTHYHLPDRLPFQNLSDLKLDACVCVIAELERQREAIGLRRVFGRRYMRLRQLTETKMRSLFVDAGGKPERQAPHYFVLGTSNWFRGLAMDMREVVLPLERLPPETTSLTFPDSFTAMALGPQFGLPHFPKPYHERVFRLHELRDLIAMYGLPADEVGAVYEGYQKQPFEKYVEVQLWSDEPVREHLRHARVAKKKPVGAA